jgi:CHASE2 domain-containing sensor protein
MDADGVVRKYANEFEIDGEPKKKSFVRMIAEQFPGERKDLSAEDTKIINFASRKDFPRCDAEELLRGPQIRTTITSAGDTQLSFNKQHDFGGKIVLIGGEFEDSRDVYPTPGNHGLFPVPTQISGVELNAQGIEEELDSPRRPIKEAQWWLALALDVIMGTLFVGVFWFVLEYLHTRPWFTSRRLDKLRVGLFVGATVLTIVVAIFTSWLLFKASIWMSFIPILVGANIHQYVDHAKAIRK